MVFFFESQSPPPPLMPHAVMILTRVVWPTKMMRASVSWMNNSKSTRLCSSWMVEWTTYHAYICGAICIFLFKINNKLISQPNKNYFSQLIPEPPDLSRSRPSALSARARFWYLRKNDEKKNATINARSRVRQILSERSDRLRAEHVAFFFLTKKNTVT